MEKETSPRISLGIRDDYTLLTGSFFHDSSGRGYVVAWENLLSSCGIDLPPSAEGRVIGDKFVAWAPILLMFWNDQIRDILSIVHKEDMRVELELSDIANPDMGALYVSVTRGVSLEEVLSVEFKDSLCSWRIAGQDKKEEGCYS